VRTFLSIGSNDNPQQNIALAIELVKKSFVDVVVSSVYQSPSITQRGADYYNLVVSFSTNLAAESVVSQLKAIERALGRSQDKLHSSKVPIDLDLLLYGDFNGLLFKGLANQSRVPHPDLLSHSFILGPLVEICAELKELSTGESYNSLWRKFDKTAHPLIKLQ